VKTRSIWRDNSCEFRLTAIELTVARQKNHSNVKSDRQSNSRLALFAIHAFRVIMEMWQTWRNNRDIVNPDNKYEWNNRRKIFVAAAAAAATRCSLST